MKVLLTTDSYLPRLGGQEMGALRLSKYLRRRGHQVRIFTTEKHTWDGPEEENLEVIRAPHRFHGRDRKRLRSRLELLFRESDVVHSRYCYRLAAIAAPITRQTSTRFVVSLHGLGLIDNPHDPWWKRIGHRRYRQVSLSTADAVIATSGEFATLAAQYRPREGIHVIPNGVDTDDFDATRPAPPDLLQRYVEDEVILAIRRLVPKNGIQYLVQAAPEVLAAFPKARFVIGGWGSQEEELRSLAERLGVGARFDFVGAIPNRLVPGYLALARTVVFPSTMESTSHACLEAMAMSRPVVASRLGGLKEMLSDGRGVLVDLFPDSGSTYHASPLLPADRVSRLARAINGVLSDPSRAQALGEAGRHYALQNYDWNLLVEKILSVYRGQAGFASHLQPPRA